MTLPRCDGCIYLHPSKDSKTHFKICLGHSIFIEESYSFDYAPYVKLSDDLKETWGSSGGNVATRKETSQYQIKPNCVGIHQIDFHMKPFWTEDEKPTILKDIYRVVYTIKVVPIPNKN